MMKSKRKSATHIICLVNRSVLGKDGSKYQSKIESYLKSNGPEWTVNRLKACYTASLHLKNGDLEKAKMVYRDNSISYTKTGFPKDDILALPMRRFVSSRTPSKLKAYAAVLRSYTAITLSDLSRSQCEKAVKTISSPPRDEGDRDLALKVLKNSIALVLRDRKLANHRPSLKRKNMGLAALKPFTSCYSPVNPKGIPAEIVKKPYFKAIYSLMNTVNVPESIKEFIPSFEMTERLPEKWLCTHDDPRMDKAHYAGKIYTIQEGGCKGRTVAIPNAWIQMGFAPLHHALSELTERHFNDVSCVSDQSKGFHALKEHVSSGKAAYSVDLSAATDRFPIELQTHLLRELGYSQHAKALEDICSMKWEFPQGNKYGVTDVTYRTGQPMGLYGSFPLFNLTHICVADSVRRLVRDQDRTVPVTFTDGTVFKVIGDDIVWSDKDLADTYTSILGYLGVDVSPTKTFSGNVAEFAGFVVMPANNLEGTFGFRPYKFPKEDYVSNPINLADSIGVKVLNTIKNPYWKKVFSIYAETIPYRKVDLTPIFTDTPENSGISGTVRLEHAVSLRDWIIHYDKWDHLSSRESWKCQEPLVYEGSLSPSDLKSSLSKAQHVDLSEKKEPSKYSPTKRIKNDPLMKEKYKERRRASTMGPTM